MKILHTVDLSRHGNDCLIHEYFNWVEINYQLYILHVRILIDEKFSRLYDLRDQDDVNHLNSVHPEAASQLSRYLADELTAEAQRLGFY